MRQLDPKFSDILNRIRVGECTDEDERILRKRVISVDQSSPKYPINSLHLFATNKECDAHNWYCLQRLGTPISTLQAVDNKLDRQTKLICI